MLYLILTSLSLSFVGDSYLMPVRADSFLRKGTLLVASLAAKLSQTAMTVSSSRFCQCAAQMQKISRGPLQWEYSRGVDLFEMRSKGLQMKVTGHLTLAISFSTWKSEASNLRKLLTLPIASDTPFLAMKLEQDASSLSLVAISYSILWKGLSNTRWAAWPYLAWESMAQTAPMLRPQSTTLLFWNLCWRASRTGLICSNSKRPNVINPSQGLITASQFELTSIRCSQILAMLKPSRSRWRNIGSTSIR